VLLVIVGVINEVMAIGLVGVLFGVGGLAYTYTQYTSAIERIRENERNIEENEPDGEVTFVSQVGVPMYLVPYQDRHMIFDGLKSAPKTTLELANIKGDELVAERGDFDELKRTFDEQFGDETTVSPEFADKIAPGVSDHRRLEKPLTDRIDAMTELARDIDRETVEVNVHTNNTKSKSLQTLADQGLLKSNGDLPLIETNLSIAEGKATVDEIRGVEEQAVSGDVLSQAREQRDRIDEVTAEMIDRLQQNDAAIESHLGKYASAVETMTHKHVCEECLSKRIEQVTDELNLVDEILSSEAGSLGAALSDQDLDRGTDEQFTARIRSEIQERIPELDDQLKQAYNSLEDLGQGEGFCEIHGRVETRRIADSGAVFGEVWRSLYWAFREPIMDSIDDLERDAEEVRQKKEQKMIDLTQYEQIKDRAEREYQSVKSEYEAARTVEQQLR
jgi:hypothetical protein